MSKIQDFVDGYSSKIQVELNTQIDKQTIYKTTRKQAITISELNTSGWPNSSTTTIGQLIAYIFPNEDGGEKKLPEAVIGGNTPNPDYINVITILNGNQSSVTTKELYTKLEQNYRAKTNISRLNNSKNFGGQKWFDNFMSSALGIMSSTNIKMLDFKTPSTLEESFDDLVENFQKNFGTIAYNYYTTIQVLYDAFIEAGDNYYNQVSTTQSGTQSVTQSISNPSINQVGDYKITIKDPKSDNDNKIQGSISFVSNGPDITTKAVLNNLPNPFTNPVTNPVNPIKPKINGHEPPPCCL